MGAEIFVSTRMQGVSVGGYGSLNLGRHVGDSDAAVTENRNRFFEAINADKADFVSIQQTHGSNIRLITCDDRGRGLEKYSDAFPDTDGMLTVDKNVLMATFYADCLPLALFDPVHKVLGLAHAGWRGTYANIGAALLKEMTLSFGSDPREVLFAMGPGIGFCCYEVDKTFHQRFVERYEEAPQWFTAKPKNGKYYFDNTKANTMLLKKEGILEEHIESISSCTCCNQRLFYSYRGSGGSCGRHGLFGRLL